MRIIYYTFVDPCINYYLQHNKNFIQLTRDNDFLILYSEDEGLDYVSTLRELGVLGKFIYSSENRYQPKFNRMLEHIKENQGEYADAIFCKIDVDLIHYCVSRFHKEMKRIFSSNPRSFVGAMLPNRLYIRGGLNAIHASTLLSCPPLNDVAMPDDFDIAFSNLLTKEKLVDFVPLEIFKCDQHIFQDGYATHTLSRNLSHKKCEEVVLLNKQLNALRDSGVDL